MASFNFKDFYIGYQGHPRYKSSSLIEDDVVRTIIQKYEMIIFTNKGDLLGDPDFGTDLVRLLHETRLSSNIIEGNIIGQILKYIPELNNVNYELKVDFVEDPERHQEVMVIGFRLKDYEVYATVI